MGVLTTPRRPCPGRPDPAVNGMNHRRLVSAIEKLSHIRMPRIGDAHPDDTQTREHRLAAAYSDYRPGDPSLSSRAWWARPRRPRTSRRRPSSGRIRCARGDPRGAGALRPWAVPRSRPTPPSIELRSPSRVAPELHRPSTRPGSPRKAAPSRAARGRPSRRRPRAVTDGRLRAGGRRSPPGDPAGSPCCCAEYEGLSDAELAAVLGTTRSAASKGRLGCTRARPAPEGARRHLPDLRGPPQTRSPASPIVPLATHRAPGLSGVDRILSRRLEPRVAGGGEGRRWMKTETQGSAARGQHRRVRARRPDPQDRPELLALRGLREGAAGAKPIAVLLLRGRMPPRRDLAPRRRTPSRRMLREDRTHLPRRRLPPRTPARGRSSATPSASSALEGCAIDCASRAMEGVLPGRSLRGHPHRRHSPGSTRGSSRIEALAHEQTLVIADDVARAVVARIGV